MQIKVMDNDKPNLNVGDVVVDDKYVNIIGLVETYDNDGNKYTSYSVTSIDKVHGGVSTTVYKAMEQFEYYLSTTVYSKIYSQDEYELQLVRKNK